MLKLLLILAVATAIAAAAHSAPLEFQHLEDSDADLLLADVADDLDLNDELDLNDAVDEQAGISETAADDELVVEEGCPIGESTENSKDGKTCQPCPAGQTTSYGTVGGNVCKPCGTGYRLNDATKLCFSDCDVTQIDDQADLWDHYQRDTFT